MTSSQEAYFAYLVHQRVLDGELAGEAAREIVAEWGVPLAEREALAERIAVRAAHHNIDGTEKT